MISEWDLNNNQECFRLNIVPEKYLFLQEYIL